MRWNMKLKYYMMGLGVGIILTTLVFIISGYRKIPSDTEIKERALKLGMVMDKEQEDALSKIINKTELTEVPTNVPEIQPTDVPELLSETKPSKEPSKEPAATSAVIFTIEPGMSSQAIAKLLQKKGLIDNAENFNSYITALDKAGSMITGMYSISQGASYDEIVKEIAP
jgi:hypothetical protein